MAKTTRIVAVPQADDYVMQAHVLSRAAYMMPVIQRRLLHLIMAQVQMSKEGFKTVEMSVGDVHRALHMPVGGRAYEELRAAATGLIEQSIKIQNSDGYTIISWVTFARFIKSRDVMQFRLSPELLPYILDLQNLFRRLPVATVASLQGKYAYRLYEIVMAAEGFKGTGGNAPDCWFTDLEFDHLRQLLVMTKSEYKVTAEFRRRVIDNPIREINGAGLGIHITADYEYFRRGRRLLGVRLKAKLTHTGEPRNVTPTHEEDEEEALKTLNQKLYDKLLAEEPDDMFGGDLARQANAWRALLKHPDLKPLPKKRSRKASI